MLQITNNQTGDRRKYSTRSRLKKKNSFWQDASCEPSWIFVLHWEHLQVIERVYFFQIFIVNYNNCGTYVHLPYSRLASWRWKELELLRYSNYLRLQSASSWTGQDCGASNTGMEPCINIKVVYLSFVCQSQTLKSRCPVSSRRHQISGLSNLSVSLGRWLKANGDWVWWYKDFLFLIKFFLYLKLIISLMPTYLDCAFWTRLWTCCSLQRCER